MTVIEVKTVWKGFVRILKNCNKNKQLWKKETIPLTDEENKSYKKQNVCYICKKGFGTDDDNKKYHKGHIDRVHFQYTGKFRGAAHNICNLRYKTPKEISIVLHNGSEYDYHFIIKELAKEFEG